MLDASTHHNFGTAYPASCNLILFHLHLNFAAFCPVSQPAMFHVRPVSTGVMQTLPDDAPVLILLPGLTGGSHDSYVRHMVGAASMNGMRAVVFNSRGTSDGAVTSPQFYSASYTGDMRSASMPAVIPYSSCCSLTDATCGIVVLPDMALMPS